MNKLYEKWKVANTAEDRERWEQVAYAMLAKEFDCPIRITCHWSSPDFMNTVDLSARARPMTNEEIMAEQAHGEDPDPADDP